MKGKHKIILGIAAAVIGFKLLNKSVGLPGGVSGTDDELGKFPNPFSAHKKFHAFLRKRHKKMPLPHNLFRNFLKRRKKKKVITTGFLQYQAVPAALPTAK